MGRDIKGAVALTTSASGGAAAYRTDRSVVFRTGDFFGDLHEQYSGLDHASLGMRPSALGALPCPGRAATADARLAPSVAVILCRGPLPPATSFIGPGARRGRGKVPGREWAGARGGA
jgi:hypothetical protein